MKKAFTLSSFLAAVTLFATAPGFISLRVSKETVPAGGVAQIKISTTEPHPIISSGTDMRFDGDALGIGVFSPAGDAAGVAVKQPGGLAFSIISPTATMGMATDYPILTVAIRTPDTSPVGARQVLSLGPNTSFLGPFGIPYQIAAKDGSIATGGQMSVDNVVPGGGVVAAGEPVSIMGRGFRTDTEVRIGDAPPLSKALVSPNEIRVVFSAAVNMTAKRIRLRTRATGEQLDYYSYLRAAVVPTGSSAVETAYPLFPAAEARTAIILLPEGSGLALLNTTAAAQTFSIEKLNAFGVPAATASVDLAGRSRTTKLLSSLVGPGGAAIRVSAPGAFSLVGIAPSAQAPGVRPVNAFVVRAAP